MNLIRNSETSLAFLLVIVALTLGGRIPQKSHSFSKRGLDIDKVPQNTAVYAGATVTFTCWVSGESENPRVQWTEFAYNDNGQLISDADFILPAHPQSDRYSLVRDNPLQYDLVISNVNINDGGVYSCYDANAQVTQKQRAAAQLIVIAGPQNCTGTIPESGDVMEGHYHTVECTLDYGGGIIPNGRWSGPQPFGQAQSSTDERVWSGMSFYAHRTMRGLSWTSKFNFTNNFLPVPVDTAENIPDFENTFTTTSLTVYWSPRNMYADPMKDEYQVGDLIQCFADAFPAASFEWHNLRTNERYPGSVFTVTQDYEGTSQIMRCQAVNTINNLPYSNDLYVNVYVPGPTTTPTTTTPTTTTTPPPVSSCFNLTGRWESVGPTPAYMCLEVLSETGNIHGVLRNDTDTFWVDLIGLSEPNNYDHASFTGIWPLNRAVSTFIGECSRCHGVEHLLINAISRSKGGPPCATPGEINYSLQYDFLRNPDIACPPITIPDNTFEK